MQKSPEANPSAGQMEKGLVHEGVTLEALGDAAKAVKPGKEPFHHPAIAGKLPVSVRTVLEFSSIRSTSQGNTVANATPNQPEAKGLAIVAPIRRQARGTGARGPRRRGTFTLAKTRGAAVMSATLPSAR